MRDGKHATWTWHHSELSLSQPVVSRVPGAKRGKLAAAAVMLDEGQ